MKYLVVVDLNLDNGESVKHIQAGDTLNGNRFKERLIERLLERGKIVPVEQSVEVEVNLENEDGQ